MENLGPSVSPQGTGNLQTPSTPRIDISRASSSSHHDSRDSSPENAIFGISDSRHDPEGAKLGLGFREDGAADLRSSTEELAFLEPNTATTEKESSKQPSRRSPLMFKPEDHHRKDSQCSDIVLLSISGRTSRLSSIGSQGSAHSNVSAHSNMSHISAHSNVSHISGQSRLSVISGISRSPSPHKMLLETSFCGPKPLENDVGVVGNDKHHTEVLEQVLLSRKHDPKDAILAEGITVGKPKEIVRAAPKAIVKTEKIPVVVEVKENNVKKPPVEPTRKESITSPVITVSTLGVSYKNDKKPSPQVVKSEPVSKARQAPLLTAKKAATYSQKSTKNVTPSGTEYIRIKLKPDNFYDEDSDSSQQEAMQKPASLNLSEHSKKNAPHFSQLVKREDSLNKISNYPVETTDVQKSYAQVEQSISQSIIITPSASPKQAKSNGDKRDNGSRTPSPSAGKTPSRKSSFCSLFKSRETIVSPESPTGSVSKRKGLTALVKETGGNSHGSRSRSKSRDREKPGPATPTSAGKQKGSVLTIFKPNRKSSASTSPVARESLPNIDLTHSSDYRYESRSVQNLRSAKERLKYYDPPDDRGFIRIPLHTPSEEEKPVVVETCTQVKEKPLIKTIVRDENLLQQIKIDRPKSAPTSSRPSFSQPSGSPMEKFKKPDPLKPIALPDGSIRIPLHSPSEDKKVRCDLMTAEEIEQLNRMCSNISTKKSDKTNGSVSISSSTDVSKMTESEKTSEPEQIIETKIHETLIEPVEIDSIPDTPNIEQVEVEIERNPDEEKLSSQAKKHIIFTTKVGSKEQLFSTQFSLSKTDSQSSQMSESRSQISEESVIEVQLEEKCNEEVIQRSASVESKSNCEITQTHQEIEASNASFIESIIHRQQIIEEIPVRSIILRESKISIESVDSGNSGKEYQPDIKVKHPTLAETFCMRNSVPSLDETVHDSSESERDSELDFIRKKQLLALEKAGLGEMKEVDSERKGLVLQQDSFDDELPYIPTTLPQERSVALPIVPIKQRQTIEVKTCPIERPRSTTPINPSCLEEYCSDEVYTPDTVKAEKLKICLPTKEELQDKAKVKQKTKSPRRISAGASPKTWFEFAEQGISNPGTRKSSTGHESDSDPAPPLPPRAPVPKTQWINFENIPERRKAPKRIQTIPSRTNVEVGTDDKVVYTYVNPEDCKCECHESGKDASTVEDATPDKEEDEEPLLDECADAEGLSAPPVDTIVQRRTDSTREKRSVMSDASRHRHSGATNRTSVSSETNSNRSSMTSQDADRSSSSGSPNDGAIQSRRSQRSP